MKSQKISIEKSIANQVSGRTIVELYEYIETHLMPSKGYATVTDLETEPDDVVTIEKFTVYVFNKVQPVPQVFKVRAYRSGDWSCSCVSHHDITPSTEREFKVMGFEQGRGFELTVTSKELRESDGDGGRSLEIMYVMIDHLDNLNGLELGHTITIPVARDGDYGTAVVFRSK